MTIKKCRCGKDFEDEGFKTMCPSCFAKSMNGSKYQSNDKEADIHKQVFLKIASEQKRGTAEELIGYAKELERVYNKW